MTEIPINWHLETRKISSLKPHPKNPRQLSKDQNHHLSESISKFGLADKPIINTDGMIIGGHQRVKIFKKIGHKEIECWCPSTSLTEEQVNEFNVRLNKNTGSFDYEVLANEWEMFDLMNWGFNENELLGIFDKDEVDEEATSEKKKSKSKTCPSCGHEF